ncbi:dihydrofolate reductase family protein [Flexivirga lutea]
MTEFSYFTACTINGFIADSDNSLQWLFDVPTVENDSAIPDYVDSVGALVMGATTYSWVLDHEQVVDQPDKWRYWYGDRPTWVFTHRALPTVPGADIRFVSGDVADHRDAVSASAGERKVWLLGGGELVGAFDDAGALDEICLGMVPVALDTGASMLPRRITSERLSLVDVRQVGQRMVRAEAVLSCWQVTRTRCRPRRLACSRDSFSAAVATP